ncbi:MAG: DUF4829 domain-containing protein [Bacillota bacterium]
MGLLNWLFGRRRDDSPAANWIAQRATADPETVIHEHFAALAAHDLDWILATLTPERGRLYTGPTTMDKRRLSIKTARVVGLQPEADAPVEPVPGYPEQAAYRVEYELELGEERRDPSLSEGRQWAYYLLVRQRAGKPWMIADWGR